MLKLGIIGTGAISKQFLDSCEATGRYRCVAVYSRSVETAKSFSGSRNDIAHYDDLSQFLADESLDVVYIASPNSLHYEHTLAAIAHQKHVIVEKPAFSNSREWEHVHQAAHEAGVYVLEAVRHIYEPNFIAVTEWVSQHRETLDGALLPFLQFSSRIEKVYAGEEPNVFSLRYSGGTLADLGVYALYCARCWFGQPLQMIAQHRNLVTGVDGFDTIILQYETFAVTLVISKVTQSYLPAEIYAREHTLQVSELSRINTVIAFDAKSKTQTPLHQDPAPHVLYDEALAFAEIIQNQQQERYEHITALSRDVNQLMQSLREQMGIVFDADNKGE